MTRRHFYLELGPSTTKYQDPGSAGSQAATNWRKLVADILCLILNVTSTATPGLSFYIIMDKEVAFLLLLRIVEIRANKKHREKLVRTPLAPKVIDS